MATNRTTISSEQHQRYQTDERRAMDADDDCGYQVELFVYDLTKGLARTLSSALLGKQIDGVWHTGIVAYGREYFFGSAGIESCKPGGTILGEPDRIETLGESQVPYQLFLEYIFGLGESAYRPGAYDLLKHNCNNFSDEIAQFLCGRGVPKAILQLPEEVLNTPLGLTLNEALKKVELKHANSRSINFGPLSSSLSSAPRQFVRSSYDDPEFDALNDAIDQVRHNSVILEERRNSLNDKLSKKERKERRRERRERKEKRRQERSEASEERHQRKKKNKPPLPPSGGSVGSFSSERSEDRRRSHHSSRRSATEDTLVTNGHDHQQPRYQDHDRYRSSAEPTDHNTTFDSELNTTVDTVNNLSLTETTPIPDEAEVPAIDFEPVDDFWGEQGDQSPRRAPATQIEDAAAIDPPAEYTDARTGGTAGQTDDDSGWLGAQQTDNDNTGWLGGAQTDNDNTGWLGGAQTDNDNTGWLGGAQTDNDNTGWLGSQTEQTAAEDDSGWLGAQADDTEPRRPQTHFVDPFGDEIDPECVMEDAPPPDTPQALPPRQAPPPSDDTESEPVPEVEREPPILFKEDLDARRDFDELVGSCMHQLAAEEQQHMEELRAYVVEDDGAWALGENFGDLFTRIFHDPNIPDKARLHLTRILAVAALKDDVILLLHQDRKDHTIMNFANKIEQLAPELQEAIALFFCNMFEHVSPSEWLLYISEWNPEGSMPISNIRVTTKVAVNALLHSNAKVSNYGTALMYNLGTKEVKTVVFDDVAPELAMAILQYFSTRPSEELMWRTMKALCRFCYSSSEVPSLIKMIGPEPSTFKGTSERIDSEIEEITAKLSRVRMY